jgi:hypothetical protein
MLDVIRGEKFAHAVEAALVFHDRDEPADEVFIAAHGRAP